MTAQERASLWLDTDQWAAPEGSGASVESSESRPPYDELDADPMFRETWPMPGEQGNTHG